MSPGKTVLSRVPRTLAWRLRCLFARAWFALDAVRGHRRIKRRFLERHRYELDLRDPQTHSEKIQYRKLFDHRDIYPRITDKIEARTVVDEVLGAGSADRLMVPVLAVAERFDDLDPALRHRDLMIKASHGSGWNRIMRADNEEDWADAASDARHWLSHVYGLRGLEWAYLGLRPRLLVETLLPDVPHGQATDFKIYCFDGVIRYVMLENNRTALKRCSVYDRDLTLVDGPWSSVEQQLFEKPVDFEQIQSVAEKLAAGFDMLRVDFLLQKDRWYLGEMDLYDGSGFVRFRTEEADKAFGQFWTVPNRKTTGAGDLVARRSRRWLRDTPEQH